MPITRPFGTVASFSCGAVHDGIVRNEGSRRLLQEGKPLPREVLSTSAEGVSKRAVTWQVTDTYRGMRAHMSRILRQSSLVLSQALEQLTTGGWEAHTEHSLLG